MYQLIQKHVPGSLKACRKEGQTVVDLIVSIIMVSIMVMAIAALSLYLFVAHSFTMAAGVGARTAAVEPDLGDPDTYAQGEASVKQRVEEFIEGSTGVDVGSGDITVDGPNGTVGNRTVTVSIQYTFENPIQVLTALSNIFGGDYGDDTFEINSSATMRYEE